MTFEEGGIRATRATEVKNEKGSNGKKNVKGQASSSTAPGIPHIRRQRT